MIFCELFFICLYPVCVFARLTEYHKRKFFFCLDFRLDLAPAPSRNYSRIQELFFFFFLICYPTVWLARTRTRKRKPLKVGVENWQLHANWKLLKFRRNEYCEMSFWDKCQIWVYFTQNYLKLAWNYLKSDICFQTRFKSNPISTNSDWFPMRV